jgi:MFS family permease
MFTVFGVGYSFGAFFESMADEFDTGSGATALSFSITIALSFFLARWTGLWGDRFGPRPLLIAAAISLSTGLLATTIVPNIYVGYFTYGIGVGLAVALAYVPLVSAVATWFDKKRSTATGIAVAGIGLGTMVGSPASAALIEATTWRTTYVIYAIVGAVLLLAAAAVARPGPSASDPGVLPGFRDLFAKRDFRVLYAVITFSSLGLFVPFVFVATYAKDRGASELRAAALISMIGGASVVGRLGFGALADRVGAMRLFRLSISVMTASHLVWMIAGDRYWQLIIYAIVLGLGYGGFIALSPVVTAQRFGLVGLGGVLGTLYTSAGVGTLFGPPIAGVLRDEFGYRTAIAFAATTTAIAVIILTSFRPTHSAAPL